jgi:hypothetical protein
LGNEKKKSLQLRKLGTIAKSTLMSFKLNFLMLTITRCRKMTPIKATNNKALGCIILLALASCTSLIILQKTIVRIDSPAVTLDKTEDEEFSYSSSHNNTYLDNKNPLSFRGAQNYAAFDSPGKGSDVSMPKNKFLVDFTQAVNATYNKSASITAIPLILSNMTLYCPRTLRNSEMNSTSGWMLRARAAVEMIQTVLDLRYHGELEGSFLPIFVLIGDGFGCRISDGFDMVKYPRLSWALPATKYSEYFGSKWCNTIGLPSYEIWFSFRSHKDSSSWDSTFAMYSERYPWNGKLKKAVWRGSSTYQQRYNGLDLSETPRGKLVQLSMTNPGLIDAAFVQLIQQYEGQKDALTNKTILADRMRFDDQMKYKAIIDIDGNNWSSRFIKLLCTNSVVIKVNMFCCLGMHYFTINWFLKQFESRYHCSVGRTRFHRVLLRRTQALSSLCSCITRQSNKSCTIRPRRK